MGIKTKATRGGNYVCKVGYFDIRQKINKPTQEKNRKGETPPPKGSTEASIFHGRELYIKVVLMIIKRQYIIYGKRLKKLI